MSLEAESRLNVSPAAYRSCIEESFDIEGSRIGSINEDPSMLLQAPPGSHQQKTDSQYPGFTFFWSMALEVLG